MSVDCDSDEYTKITLWAGGAFCLLPVGVPVMMHWIMHTKRHIIEARTTRTGDEELEYMAVWFAPYKPDKWW